MGESSDVVILGGGPAGTATALALRRHEPALSILVVEASDYRRMRIGESLPPPTRKLLEHLGVWEVFRAQDQDKAHDPSYGTAAAWGSDQVHDNEFLFRTYQQGWHLDRARFDALLASCAEAAGVEVWRRCAFLDAKPTGKQSRTQSGWHLRLRVRDDGEVRPITARFVVDATGRKAAFARRQGVKRTVHDDLLGLYGFFRLAPDGQPVASRTLVEAWEEGWWYSARLPGDRLVIACMSDADRIAELGLRRLNAWRSALEASRHTRRLLEGAVLEDGPICYPAQSQLLDEAAGEGWLAVGDAAATYDPLSSQGIFKALHFGIWAAYATADHLRGDAGALGKYARLVERDFEGYLDTHVAYYREETRWPSAPFWRRRHGSGILGVPSAESLPPSAWASNHLEGGSR